jgi:hypothetical protein
MPELDAPPATPSVFTGLSPSPALANIEAAEKSLTSR